MAAIACDICFSEYDFNNHRPVVGTCGHSICLACSRRINGICPNCREGSFDSPRTNYGMLQLIENRIIEKERAEKEQKDLLLAVQDTFDEVEQEKMLHKLNLKDNKVGGGQGSSKKVNAEEIPREVLFNFDYTTSGILISGSSNVKGPIFVYSIKEGSPAEGWVRVGDQILSVNGISLLEKTVYEANEILIKAGNTLKLCLQYKPQEFQQNSNAFKNSLQKLLSEKKNPMRGELFVKALDFGEFLENNALKFYFGDILQITHKSEKKYWIARKILPDGSNSEKGVIYSSESHKEIKREIYKSNGIDETAFSYLVVKKHIDNSTRPIVVLGALKEKIIKSLMEKRPSLIGRIISLLPSAIRALHQGKIYPIVIFIGPQFRQEIIDLSNGQMSENEAEKELKEVRKLAKETPLFTKRFYGDDTFEETVSLALEHIDEESRPDYWIPSEDSRKNFHLC